MKKYILLLTLFVVRITCATDEVNIPAAPVDLSQPQTSQDIALKQMFPDETCYAQAKELYDSYTQAKEKAKKSEIYIEEKKFICDKDHGYYNVKRKDANGTITHTFYVSNGTTEALENERNNGLILQSSAPFYKRWWRSIFGS